MREQDIRAPDGTRIRAWRAATPGAPVLLCAGPGTVPESWPTLIAPSAGLQALSWAYRGTLGSSRPADEARVELADHVGDAIAVLDDAGLRHCVVVGWSMGVTVAVELARRHPERVSGLCLVAGTPGDAFGAAFGLLGLPIPVRRLLARTGVQALRAAGPLLNAVVHHLPIDTVVTLPLRLPGVLPKSSDPAAIASAIREFTGNDWPWYFTLALVLGSVPRQTLAGITCPVTVLAGRYDVLCDPASVFDAAGPLPQARMRLLPGTHFLPLEVPDVVADELRLLVDRAQACDDA
jgi:pimeloyl-ACP methyl ester carboxylesterase